MVDAARVAELMAANSSPDVLMEELNMSTPQEKLERRFRAWWCARGYMAVHGRGDEYDKAREDIKFGWIAAMKEQG